MYTEEPNHYDHLPDMVASWCATKTALTQQDMEPTKPLKVVCDIWYKHVTIRLDMFITVSDTTEQFL